MDKSGTTPYKQTKFGILPRPEVLKLEVQGVKKGLKILQTGINPTFSIERVV